MKERSKVIDRAKGIAILLVVLGHINSPLGPFIFSFHMPLFFFFSGLFINEKMGPKIFIKKNLYRLMIPFIVFGLLGWIVEVIKGIALNRPVEDLVSSALGLFFWMDASHLHHYGFILWFLPALFWARLMFYLLIKYLKVSFIELFLIVFLIGSLALHLPILPYSFDKGLIALPWIAAGYLFGKIYNDELVVQAWQLGLCTVAVGLVIFLLGVNPIDFANKKLGQLWVTVTYSVSLAAWILVFLVFSERFNHFQIFKVLEWLGKCTLLVMVIHVYTNNAAYLLVNKIFGPGYWLIIFLTSMALIFLLMCVKKNYPNSILFKSLD